MIEGLPILAALALLALEFYLLPSCVAVVRNHRNWISITVLNVLLGWTFIGWMVAMIWACSVSVKVRRG